MVVEALCHGPGLLAGRRVREGDEVAVPVIPANLGNRWTTPQRTNTCVVVIAMSPPGSLMFFTFSRLSGSNTAMSLKVPAR